VAQRDWTCDQQVVGLNPTRGKSGVSTLGKLLTPMCLCHQGAVTLCGWEGNRRPGGN